MAAALRAHVETWRPYTLAYPLLVGVAGAVAPPGHPSPGRILLVAAVAVAGWVGAHYLADVADRELDALAKPGRPIPSGRLGVRTATAVGAALIVGAAVVLLVTNPRVAALAAIGMLCALGYALVLKSRGIWGNLVRGAATALALICGAMMTHPLPPASVLVVAGALLLHDTASNLVGTLRDVDGDREGGFSTVPVRHGLRRAVRLAVLFYGGSLVASVSAVPLLTGAGAYLAYLAFVAVAAGVGVAAFAPLVGAIRAGRAPSAAQALTAHEVLVAERLLLASALVAAGAGVLAAAVLLAVLLPASLVTQRGMRRRHELAGPTITEGT